MSIDRSEIGSILVIKLRAIGDVLLSTIVLRNLRSAYPDARIDMLTEKPSREVLEGNPDIDTVVVFDGNRQSGMSIIFKVLRRRYDLVIDLFGNPRSAIITLLSSARYRIGYKFGWRRYCYNVVVEPRGGHVHNAEFNLDALRGIGIPIINTSVHMPTSGDSEQFAGDFWMAAGLNGKRVIALNPGGGWYTKRWRLPHFSELGDLVADEFNAEILVMWGPGEEEDAQMIRSFMRTKPVVAPRTSLKQLAALLKRCAMLVTNDSGPMHIAAAVNTPVVAVFGPTDPDLQGPYGVEHEIVQNRRLVCLGCNYTKCPIGNPCMEELSANEVFASVKSLVRRCGVFIEQS